MYIYSIQLTNLAAKARARILQLVPDVLRKATRLESSLIQDGQLGRRRSTNFSRAGDERRNGQDREELRRAHSARKTLSPFLLLLVLF